MAGEEQFLGRGWSFPPAFDHRAAAVVTATGIEDIEQSLAIIFSTALGERVMNPTFGCSLEDSVFEAMNASHVTYVEHIVKTAVLYHEPRIDAETVEVVADQSRGTLVIHIEYTVRATNSRFNFVYPFYVEPAEG